MAINPPSDLVLDVANAADPATLQASVEKLRSLAAARVEAQTRLSRETFASIQQAGTPTGSIGSTSAPGAPNPAYTKFESFMLQSFVESMFTGDNQAVFGKGIAGDYWKSMMAEAVAKQMADAGGIGVARMLEQQSANKAKSAAASAAPAVSGDQTPDPNVILYQIERQLIHKQLKTTKPLDAIKRG